MRNARVTISGLIKAMGLPVTPQTVRRWITQGCRGRKLQAEMVGGRFMVRIEAVQQFLSDQPEASPLALDARAALARQQLRDKHGI